MIRRHKRLLCDETVDGGEVVHVATATYAYACDTLCGRDVLPVNGFWLEGDPELPPRGPTCAACIERMYRQETPMQQGES